MDASAPSMQQPTSTLSSANSHTLFSSSTGPQIRSRITVVCAECKRLKLKCDRRAPCGSCTKRDTVARCIYSPAAAEKIDLHSLNNRMIQVEATLAMLTAGQIPPAFQSIYPFSYPSSATGGLPSNPASLFIPPHQGSHQHHHHYAAPSSYTSANNPFMPSPQDIVSIWLEELDLGVSWSFSSAPSIHHPSSGRYIKLEPSSIDIELSPSHPKGHDSPLVIDVDSLEFPTRSAHSSMPLRDIHQQRPSAQMLLPVLSIYYPVPSISPPGTSCTSSSTFPHHPSPTYPNVPGYQTQPQPQDTKPQVTPALLELLPPLSRCKSLLLTARDIFRVRPVPFEPSSKGWTGFERRCLALIGGGANQDRERERLRKETVRENKHAQQIYFTGLQQDDADMDEATTSGNRNGGESKQCTDEQGNSEEHSLTFFATMCAVLAIGAAVPSSMESPAFFYALSQQALGVWDTHTSSGTAVPDEVEKMDYLLACLVCVEYLLLTGSASRSAEEIERDGGHGSLYTLVGRLVTVARGLGLGQDSYSSRKSKATVGAADKKTSANVGSSMRETTKKEKRAEKERARKEWRRMLLWDVMFYDLFTADVLGHQPYIASYLYSMKLPACSSHPLPPEGDDHGSEDEDQDFGNGMQMQPDEFNSRNRRQSTFGSLASNNSENQASYLGARYRLTQLAQAIKNQIVHPECCCGYTLDQAASLEDEVRRWQSNLPSSLKLPETPSEGSCSPPPFRDLPDDPITADKALQVQSCELAVMANILVVKIYTPFLRHASAHGHSDSRQVPSTPLSAAGFTGVNPPVPPAAISSRAVVNAAQIIIRAAKVLQTSQPSLKTANLSEVLPSMFDFYPLDTVLFNSLLICAHAALTGGASTFAFNGAVLLDDVTQGSNLLSDICAGPGLGETHKRVIEALQSRILHRGVSPFEDMPPDSSFALLSLPTSFGHDSLTASASVAGQPTTPNNEVDLQFSLQGADLEKQEEIELVNCWIAAEHALHHIQTKRFEIESAFFESGLRNSEYVILAGFDESVIRNGIGYLEQVHIFTSADIVSNTHLLISLGKILSPFSSILFSEFSQPHRLPVFKPDGTPWKFNDLVFETASKLADCGSSASYYPTVIALSRTVGGATPVSSGSGGRGGLWSTQRGGDDSEGQSGNQDGEDERQNEDRNYAGRKGDPNDPEEPGSKSEGEQEPNVVRFDISSDLHLNDHSERFQLLTVDGSLTIKLEKHALSTECHVQFTKLNFGTIRTTTGTAYEQFFLRVTVDPREQDANVNIKKPRQTSSNDRASRVVSASKSGWSATGTASATLALKPQIALGATGGRIGESSRSTEQVQYTSQVDPQTFFGIASCGFDIDDPSDRSRGVKITEDKLPQIDFEFLDSPTFSRPIRAPDIIDVEIKSYWTAISHNEQGFSWISGIFSMPVSPYSVLCQAVVLKIPSPLTKRADYKSRLLVSIKDLNSGHLLPEVRFKDGPAGFDAIPTVSRSSFSDPASVKLGDWNNTLNRTLSFPTLKCLTATTDVLAEFY